MQEKDDDIDLIELWRAIWAGKILIIAISLLFSIASIFYAISKPNIYRASILLAPVSSQNGGDNLAALTGQFGGLASMAGINLGRSGGDKTSIAIATLKSRFFIESFIKNNHLLIPLMASTEWDSKTETLLLNKDIYDKNKKEWTRAVKTPQEKKPSTWEAYTKFSEILSVSQDQTNSLITVELDFYSPILAKQWLNLLVKEINEFIREQEKEETQASITYLNKQLENTLVSNMENIFYQLIEEQTKTLMLAQVKKEYIFKTIDPAQVPDKKNEPKRIIIVILGTMIGGVLSVFFILIRHFTNKRTTYLNNV